MRLATLFDAIPVVQTVVERDATFPVPAPDQRAWNKETESVQRWDGDEWVDDLVFTAFGVADVTHYGATGDGTTNDTAAINQAIADAVVLGGAVIIPEGTYRVSAGGSLFALLADGSCEIVGLGNVWIKWMDGEPQFKELLRVNDSPSTGQVSGVRVRNVGFDLHQRNDTIGLRFYNVVGCSATGCRFKNGSSSGGSVTYALRLEGYTQSDPISSWSAGDMTNFARGCAIVDCHFEDIHFGSALYGDAIFLYATENCLVRGNVIQRSGRGIMIYGPNRFVSVVGNAVYGNLDNGIRVQYASAAGKLDAREITITGNVVRNCAVDGIRLNGYRLTCKGNVIGYNGNTGIKSDACVDVIIDGNEVFNNVNRGVYLSQALIAGYGAHERVTISNNICRENGGDGIAVIGGGDTGALPARGIKVIGNTCYKNSFFGIQVNDADSQTQIAYNTVEQNGDGGASFSVGIIIQAVLLSWGGALVAFNRVFDLTVSGPQAIGIRFNALTGKTLSKCYCYFNDCSDCPTNGSFFGTAIRTTGATGTVSPQFLYGSLYRNSSRGVNEAAVAAGTLAATDIIVQEDEDGDTWRPITGGYRQTIDGWTQDNVAASQTNVELTRATGRFRATRAGSVTGVIVTATEARTNGTLTVTVFKNTGLAGAAGATIGLTAVLDGTNTSRKATLQAKDLDTFAAGDELYIVVTTDGSWTPTTSDIRCAIEIED